MRVPLQSHPVARARFVGRPPEAAGVRPQLICGICEDVISGIMDALVSGGCTAIDVGFEAACNAAGDWIPIIGEGPWEVACGLGGAAIGTLCDVYGPQWLGTSAGVSAICSKMGLC